MHASVMAWVNELVVGVDDLADKRVLEVGSLNVNGTVRELFGSDYIGVDMRDGPGVDMVAEAHKLPFEDESFDVVISTEMLEHDAQFWLSLPEMGRVLRPAGGVLILTTRSNGFPEHGFPEDYWRFMPNSVGLLAALAGCDLVSWMRDPQDPGIFLACRKA